MDLLYKALVLLIYFAITVNCQTIAGELFAISGSGDFDTTTDSVDVTTTTWNFSGDWTTTEEDSTTVDVTTTTWNFSGDWTTTEEDSTTETVPVIDDTTTVPDESTASTSEETTTSWDFSGDDTTTADVVTTETTEVVSEKTTVTETTEVANETTTAVTETTEIPNTTTVITETTKAINETTAVTETTEVTSETTAVTETTQGEDTDETTAVTDGTTTTSKPGCPATCEYANSSCTSPGVECVCDFGFIGQNGGTEPPCREPFCNETCNGEGTMCNETDDCVCKDNFERIDDICTKVCPDCASHATCYSPDDGCVCDQGFSGNGTTCVDINECESVVVENCPGGKNTEAVNCVNKDGSYTCGCSNNYYYDSVENVCKQSNCDNEVDQCPEYSTCVSVNPKLTCQCDVGYEKDSEDNCADIDECEVECLSATESCKNTPGSYICNCIDGYYRDKSGGDCKEVQCPETKVSCQNLEGLCDAVNEEVTFPPTLAGYTATSTNSCAVDTESAGFPFGTRPCSLQGQWGQPTWLSSCGLSLESLATENITNENREEVSNNLEVLTSKPDDLKPEDIDSTTEAISQVTDADNVTDSVATSVVSTISNLMASPSIENASDSGELVTQLNDIASIVDLSPTTDETRAVSSPSPSSYKTISGDIAIVVQEGLPGFGVAVLRRPETSGGFRSDQIVTINEPLPAGAILETGDRVQASIYVPENANKEGTRSWIIVYGSNVLFQRNSTTAKTNQSNGLVSNNATMADKMVLSATILDTYVTGLMDSDRISYSLPVQYGIDEEPICAFWMENETDWSDGGCKVNSNTTNGSLVCQCNHLTSFAALLETKDPEDELVTAIYVLDIITIVGCTISSIALIAVIVILSFCSPMSWRGKRCHASFLLVSLSAAILGLDITLLISEIPAFTDPGHGAVYNSSSCIAIAIALHFFMLSSCAWMNCEAVVFGIAVIKPIYSRNNLQNKLVILWSILWAILMPLLFVLIVALVDINSYVYSNSGDDFVTCWLKPPDDIIYFAVIPTSIMIGFNIVVYVVLSYYLCRTRNSELGKYWKITRRSQKRRLGTNVTLATLLGLTWVFGFFMSAATYPTPTVVFAYIFTISTSLQGLFILFVTVLRNAEMRRSISKTWSTVSNAFGRTATARPGYNESLRSTNDDSLDSQYSNTSFSNPGNPYTRESEDRTNHGVITRRAATYNRRPTNNETYPEDLVIENWRTRRHSN